MTSTCAGEHVLVRQCEPAREDACAHTYEEVREIASLQQPLSAALHVMRQSKCRHK